jgi:hypothetical protein
MTYPLGYPLASSHETDVPNGRGDLAPVSATKDSRSRSSSSRRLSARKLAAVESRLSDRDREVMGLVARFRVLSGSQLQRLFWPEGTAQTRARLARHGLGRLTRLGVLAPLERRVGGVRAGSSGRCYALGLAGQRLIARTTSSRQPRRPHTPGERHLAHTLAVAGLYVQLVEAQRWGSIELLSFDPEPRCWRPYSGAWGAPLVLKPDAFVKIGVGAWAYSWLIEIDLATESLSTIERKAARHLDYHRSGTALRSTGVAPRVAWIAPDEARAESIASVLERLRPDDRKLFAVTTSEEALSLLPTGAGS